MPQPEQFPSRRPRLLEWCWIAAILIVAGLAHGINMFGYPHRDSDEGTYMSQGWAILREGRLAPYTYWYDHAPVGWVQIAGWIKLTGGLYTFGAPVNSGRVLMLILRLASILILYRITRRISHSPVVAGLAALLFALSAYDIYYGRRVLLDNIATFWMLLAFMLLVCGEFTLKRAGLSALALGISILSKEPIAAILPVMTYLVWYRGQAQQRAMATTVFVAVVMAVGSLYVLMAALHGELFPTGTWLGGRHEHVSLIGSLKWQLARDADRGLFSQRSMFWIALRFWLTWEPLLVVAGTAAAVGSLLFIKRHRVAAVAGLMSVSLWLFFGRGGTTLDFYLLPLIPLLALNLALAAGAVARSIRSSVQHAAAPLRLAGHALVALLGIACAGGIANGYAVRRIAFCPTPWVLWHNRQADSLSEAVRWVIDNIPEDSRVVIDIAMLLELREIPGRSQAFADAHWYWKVLRDPAIRDKVFENDWRNVDYVVVTPQLLLDLAVQPPNPVAEALSHSSRLAHFDTGGWPVEIRIVHKPKSALRQARR